MTIYLSKDTIVSAVGVIGLCLVFLGLALDASTTLGTVTGLSGVGLTLYPFFYFYATRNNEEVKG